MASAGSIFVDLLLRDANYKQGINRARSQTQTFGRDVGSVFSGLTSSALKLAGAFGVGISVAGITQAADKISILSARIENSTLNVGEFNQAFSELSRQAIQVGTDLSNGVEIFQRLSFSRNELKATNEEMLAFTDTVQKLGIVSGASTTALSAGLLQLGQGLSAGILRAEEFNSIMENIPAIGVAIAEEFGVSAGQLRQLVLAGEVLSEDVLTAILNKQQKANEEFEKMPVTLARGISSITTGFSIFVSRINDSINATGILGEELQGIGEILANNNKLAQEFANILDDIAIGAKTIGSFLNLFNINKSVSERAKDLKKDIEGINESLGGQVSSDASVGMAEHTQTTIKMNEALAKQSATTRELSKDYSSLAEGISNSNEKTKESQRAANELNSIYQRNRELITGLDSSVLKYQDTVRDLDALVRAGIISQDEYGQAVLRAKDRLKETTEATKVFGVDIETFSKRAAENIQDAFADFLFDPFQDGVKGMAKGFIDAVRRMIAEAQAAQLAQYLLGSAAGGKGSGALGGIIGSISGAFSTPFNPATSAPPLKPFADGGYLGPGEFGIAGEAGAELLYGGKTGVSVFNQDQLGMNKGNNYNIDARGADQGAVNRLEQALLALAGPGVIERRVGMAQQRGSL